MLGDLDSLVVVGRTAFTVRSTDTPLSVPYSVLGVVSNFWCMYLVKVQSLFRCPQRYGT